MPAEILIKQTSTETHVEYNIWATKSQAFWENISKSL